MFIGRGFPDEAITKSHSSAARSVPGVGRALMSHFANLFIARGGPLAPRVPRYRVHVNECCANRRGARGRIESRGPRED